MYFDTHAHYDDEAFDADRDALLEGLPAEGVSLVVNPGCDRKSSERALELASRWGHVYAAVGIHPEELGTMEAGDFERIEELCAREKCVAIGEIGLDYYWDDTHKQEQKASGACSIAIPAPPKWRRSFCGAAGIWASTGPSPTKTRARRWRCWPSARLTVS